MRDGDDSVDLEQVESTRRLSRFASRRVEGTRRKAQDFLPPANAGVPGLVGNPHGPTVISLRSIPAALDGDT
ncbi:hypothetical protein J1G43_12875 [Cellulomonas sp. zg-ZUI22]|uniref:hypothetical protein n=1 Tax=Cellulomonas sp. zg-ZUI22 TaxID=2816955 RepID=UPI001A93F45D|nr:hypothetical protein [Cellulomonas sp. zg-ZUI22]MBO0900857.1 hypothetical protein [Cellulomonas sp. zg-ZUI22]